MQIPKWSIFSFQRNWCAAGRGCDILRCSDSVMVTAIRSNQNGSRRHRRGRRPATQTGSKVTVVLSQLNPVAL